MEPIAHPKRSPKALTQFVVRPKRWLVNGAIAIAPATILIALPLWLPPMAAIGEFKWGPEAAIAQIISSDGVGDRVYELLPDFPRENQYISKEDGKVAEKNTLVTRLIRYHLYVKGRPPFYRLDWKLTLADYLGVNGLLNDSEYPSHSQLNQNPMKGDIAAIHQLNVAQRNALVQALVDAFSSQARRSPLPVPKPRVDLPNSNR